MVGLPYAAWLHNIATRDPNLDPRSDTMCLLEAMGQQVTLAGSLEQLTGLELQRHHGCCHQYA